jgi:hypothetical protein
MHCWYSNKQGAWNKRRDYAHLITTGTPGFSDFRRPCFIVIDMFFSTFCHQKLSGQVEKWIIAWTTEKIRMFLEFFFLFF